MEIVQLFKSQLLTTPIPFENYKLMTLINVGWLLKKIDIMFLRNELKMGMRLSVDSQKEVVSYLWLVDKKILDMSVWSEQNYP